MANYEGRTASSGATIKKGKTEALQAYLNAWGFSGDGDLVAEIRKDEKGDTLNIYGYDDFSPCPIVTKADAEADKTGSLCEGDLNYDMGNGEDFLSGLAPFLKPFTFNAILEKKKAGSGKALIIVQTAGGEKCRFPLGATEFILKPNGKVEFNGFKGY